MNMQKKYATRSLASKTEKDDRSNTNDSNNWERNAFFLVAAAFSSLRKQVAFAWSLCRRYTQWSSFNCTASAYIHFSLCTLPLCQNAYTSCSSVTHCQTTLPDGIAISHEENTVQKKVISQFIRFLVYMYTFENSSSVRRQWYKSESWK